MIELPYPPSSNRYWRSFAGRMVRSKHAIEYREDVQFLAERAGQTMLIGCVSVEMVLCPARPKDWVKRAKKDPDWFLDVKRIDLDNAQKVVLDALQGVAYENDRQITRLSIGLGRPIENGGLLVRVSRDESKGIAA
mgnify:CR=1 FL=1